MQFKQLSVIALAVAAASAQLAHASAQSDSQGFIEDADLVLSNKNYAFYRDLHGDSDDQNYRNEWAHGIRADFASGYTQGIVGFGFDAHAALGLKLNSDRSNGTSGTGLLPSDANGKAQDEYSFAGAAVKARISNTELKYGDLTPANPVFATGSARLFTGTATGFQLLSSEIDGLDLEAGHFTAIRDGSAGTNRDGDITTAYSFFLDTETPASSNSASYLGGSYAFSDNFSATLYGSQLKDVWDQYYANLNYTLPLTDTQSLNFDANLYDTSDSGSAKAGKINTTAWSLAAGYSLSGHKLTLAYQQIDGDTPFDYIAMDGQNAGDSIWLNNSVQYSDFNGPNEKSWQLRYDLDMASYGVPGLSFMARYITGDEIDGSKADTNGAYAYFGEDGKEWERNLEAKYVFQEGAAKDLSIRVRHATWRANAAGNDALGNDMDEIRVITEYPLDIL